MGDSIKQIHAPWSGLITQQLLPLPSGHPGRRWRICSHERAPDKALPSSKPEPTSPQPCTRVGCWGSILAASVDFQRTKGQGKVQNGSLHQKDVHDNDFEPCLSAAQIRVTNTYPANTHDSSDSLMPSVRHHGLPEEIFPFHTSLPTDSPVMGKKKEIWK